MPCLQTSTYQAPKWLPSGHSQTIFPSLFRRVPQVAFTRGKLTTSDGDFIILDRHTVDGHRDGGEPKTVVLLSHGLEGNSRRKYMRGMCLAFAAQGWDCLSRNFRACGGQMNLTPGMYHSGQTEDLHTVINHCLDLGYERVLLVGFSMGGNQTLKYLGEDPGRVPPQVAGAVVFSVPCDLPGAAVVLDEPRNAVYMRYFLRTLRQKVRLKHPLFPELYPLDGLDGMRTFAEFDERYTAPVHGFSSALDYWQKAACLPHLHRIQAPTLLVNAGNDPFLSPECYPVAVAEKSARFFLEIPEEGGHVGFSSPLGIKPYWSETRAVEFFRGLQDSIPS